MLDRTLNKLQSYYANELQIGVGDQRHEIDRVTRINLQQCESLNALHRKTRPDLSVETGLAYGFSTLSFLDAMEQDSYGHHIAIDPAQDRRYKGIGAAAVRQLGYDLRFTWIDDRSDRVFVDLAKQNRRVQFAYFDGCHFFEAVVADLALVDQLLDVGGVVVLNDMWMPAYRSVASYIGTNWQNYSEVDTGHDNLFAVRKTDQDRRAWDHFVPFDGAGGETAADTLPASRLSRLLKNILGR